MSGRKRWYVLGIVALLYLIGKAEEPPTAPPSAPNPNASIAYKSPPPPPAPVLAPTQPPETAIVTATRLNVRTGPSVDAEPMVQLSQGLQVTILARRDGWAQIEAGRYTGWVAAEFVSANPAAPSRESEPATKPSAEEFAYVDADRLNVRRGPGTSYQQLWTLKLNERVTVVERSGDWAKVKGARYEGWVHGGYLTAKPAPARVVSAPKASKMSATQARKILIERSIALYSGRCPCPYNVMRNGRRCGGNSAYSRPGGASPLCYLGDVSDRMVADFLARQ